MQPPSTSPPQAPEGPRQASARSRPAGWLAPHEVRALLALVAIALGLASGVALLASVIWTPAELAAGAPQAWLGLEARGCPGCALCGLSRGFALVARGELGEALALNPLVAIAQPLALAFFLALPFAGRALWRSWRAPRCAA